VAEPVQAEFYKLLVYDEGCFFASHRNTEKAPGMFATLVVLLPSTSTGGELLVRHKDFWSAIRTVRFGSTSLTRQIITGNAATSLTACGDLLARMVASVGRGREGGLRGAATALVEALPGDPQRAQAQGPWWQDRTGKPRLVIDLLEALCRIHAQLAEDAAGNMLTWPEIYKLDPVLVPAMRDLVGSGIAQEPAVQRLRDACLEHMRARIAEPLAPPCCTNRRFGGRSGMA
jgi:hypothetical protein